MNQIEYREIVINPRVINHLGRDLITTSDVAVTELIKNSIDAGASEISLNLFDDFVHIFDNNMFHFRIPDEISDFLPREMKEYSCFVIEDNGQGMNEQELNNGFLEIGTEIKLKTKEAMLGEKGIGRLAAQRLGKGLLIETASQDESYATITFVNWNELGVEPECKKVPSLKIGKVVENYTRLWVFDINMQDFVEVPQQLALDLGEKIDVPINRELKSAINFLISPYEFSNKNIISMYYGGKNLDIDFNEKMLLLSESRHIFDLFLDEHGEINLKYSLILEPWFLERVHRAMVKPEAFKRLRKSHGFYEKLLHDNKEKISAVLEKHISQNTLLEIISDVYEDLYEKSISDRSARKEYSLKCAQKVLDEICLIFPIKGEIYSFKQNSAIGEHIIIDAVNEIRELSFQPRLKDLKEFLEENNGIKLYRNKYRIGYLGNKESDWIKLQQFRTKGQQWYRFDLGNTVGYVSVSDEKQTFIKEISSRLDIIQNGVAESFKLVINIIFNNLFYELNRSANNILRVIFEQNGLLGESLKKQVKKNINNITGLSNKSKAVNQKLQKAIGLIEAECEKDNIDREVVKRIALIMQETSEHIEDEKNIHQQATVLLNEASEQLKAVEVEAYNNFKLMANGLITETITHELDSLCKTSRIVDVTSHFDYMKEYFIEKREVGVFNKHVNPIRKSYDVLSNKMLDVGNLYNFLEKTFIKKGTYDEFQYQNIGEVVQNVESNLLALKEENIEIKCKVCNMEWFVPKGVLIHVFYNLFTNAMYWIDRRRKYAQDDTSYISEKPDAIVIERIDDEEIVVYDTGTGVLKDMEEILFQPLESGKPNREGRGMGLYIVQQLLRSFSAEIQLMEERNIYNNRYKFLISVNNEE